MSWIIQRAVLVTYFFGIPLYPLLVLNFALSDPYLPLNTDLEALKWLKIGGWFFHCSAVEWLCRESHYQFEDDGLLLPNKLFLKLTHKCDSLKLVATCFNIFITDHYRKIIWCSIYTCLGWSWSQRSSPQHWKRDSVCGQISCEPSFVIARVA